MTAIMANLDLVELSTQHDALIYDRLRGAVDKARKSRAPEVAAVVQTLGDEPGPNP